MAALAAPPAPATIARDRMIEQYLPLADGLARRYRHTTEPLDDLTQVARIGLVKAVDRWDADRGYSFSTFAVPTITGELQRHFRDRTWTIRPPRDVQELYMRVKRVRAHLSTELGREPTVRDVADAIGCDVEDVVGALTAGDAYAPRSLDAPVHVDEVDSATGADLLADDGHEIARSEDAAALVQLSRVLDDRSREIVRLRFQEDLIQREIGERVGCSQMHVSRILRDALTRLREAADEANVVFD
jgi:RNA polymerase sigma-B factor